MMPLSACLPKFAAVWTLAVALGFPFMAAGSDAGVPMQQATASAVQNQAASQPAKKKAAKKPKRKMAAEPPPSPPPPPPPPPEEPLETVLQIADAPRDYVSEKFVDLVSSVDRFFGDDRTYQESRDSVLQVDVTRVMGYGGEHNFVVSGRANASLPNTEKRLHLIIETDPDKNATVDPKQTQTQPQTLNKPATPQSIAAAVRYIKEEAERWHLSADAGLKFHGLSATPFARTRGSLTVPLDLWRMKMAETVFWFNTIGVGETSQLDFERTVSESVLFRATSIATWLHDRQNFDLRQDFTVFHKLDDRAALLYQASVIGVSQPVTHVTDYVLLAQYRYRLHRKWMYFDVSPQLHFPEERSYRLSPLLSLRLEMLFDESKQTN